MNANATVPPPPGRLVTLTLGNAELAASSFCTTRALRSDEPPAPDATTMSTFLAGFHSWAVAAPGASAAAHRITPEYFQPGWLAAECMSSPRVSASEPCSRPGAHPI